MVIDLEHQKSTVEWIIYLLQEKYNIVNLVILDSKYEEIPDNKQTRGESFWSWRFNSGTKFYAANRDDWWTLLVQKTPKSIIQVKVKKVNYPLENKPARPSTGLPYYPVTLPKSYRRAFTRLSIKNNRVFVYKHVRIGYLKTYI